MKWDELVDDESWPDYEERYWREDLERRVGEAKTTAEKAVIYEQELARIGSDMVPTPEDDTLGYRRTIKGELEYWDAVLARERGDVGQKLVESPSLSPEDLQAVRRVSELRDRVIFWAGSLSDF